MWEGQGKVELWDFSQANYNKESRIETIAKIASICYGKPPKDAKKLVERLMTESAGLPSSAFEFIRGPPYYDIEHSWRNNINLPTIEELSLKKGVAPETYFKEHKENVAIFHLKIPIFVVRQLVRHRAFSYQELSRRFTTNKIVPFEYYYPPEALQDQKIKDKYTKIYSQADDIYNALRKQNVRAEVARGVIPVGSMTSLWIMGDIKAFKNYLKLRIDEHAQKEHRDVALAMLNLLKEYQPEFKGIV